MKRGDIVDLIRYHADRDDNGFNTKAASIAREFEQAGADELAGYIMALISDTRTFVPHSFEAADGEGNGSYLSKVSLTMAPLPLPDAIMGDITGIINAVSRRMGVNAFLFQGPPGTGKTESAKQIARILGRDLYTVDFNVVIDSKLGATAKNIAELFQAVNRIGTSAVVLFDEIDALALDRVNDRDVREMGRATSAFLKELDRLSEQVLLIATTNLFEQLDRALVRRFDKVVDFSRYSKDDLVEVGSVLASGYVSECGFVKSDARLVRKILESAPSLPYPGDLKNIIKTAIAFSKPNEPYDYLMGIYRSLNPGETPDPEALRKKGFTLREIEVLTGISRSTLSRVFKGASDE